MIRDELADLLQKAAEEAQQRGLLPPVAIPPVAIERPQRPEHGDYASSLPLRLARVARMSPMAIAERLAGSLPQADFLDHVEVAAPGFINFTLNSHWLAQQVKTILTAGEYYGDVNLGRGQRVQIEFVSANPVGPLHVGAGRGAALGDALGNLLTAANYQVEREYYVNDAGARMEAFYQSIYARYLQAFGQPAEIPEEGYHGPYLIDLAQQLKDEHDDVWVGLPPEQVAATIGQAAVELVIAQLREDLERMGVRFDRWFSEQSLFDDGTYSKALQLLRERGYLAEREGATWFASSILGEDKDNVLVRSTGMPTYFATDIAYHYDKFLHRGYDRVINIWGADHQGHIPRMKVAVAALGIDPDRLTIIVYQLVTLQRGGEIVRMSKRTGDIVTLRELVDEVGADACRFFLLSRSAEAQMDFDIELAKRQSSENPVYYVQYGHARIASILRYAGDQAPAEGDVSLLTHETEAALIKRMIALPELIETAARLMEPHHLTYYALDLATAFHQFYTQCRVVSDDQALTAARLKLVRAAKIVLAKALHVMGIAAPEEM
ncbi:MAG: arginine--tRNA ligase [Chloroflexi bacterium]|nr:arginine--tRNA ligase [Chloroflexota bacterium]